jgi:hypothetical protein
MTVRDGSDGGSGSVIERAAQAYAPLKAQRYQKETKDLRQNLSSLGVLLGRQLSQTDVIEERRVVETHGGYGSKREMLIWRVEQEGYWFYIGYIGHFGLLMPCSNCGTDLADAGYFRGLEQLGELLETRPVCERCAEPQVTDLEARVRQIVQEEIVDLADAEHDHSGYAEEYHVHYDLADRDHEH